MKMTAINSESKNNSFAALGDSLRAIFGDTFYEDKLAPGIEPMGELAYACSVHNEPNKDIEEVYPAFYSLYQELDIFAKIWLINETQSRNVHYSDVGSFIMEDSDRFMLRFMGYHVFNVDDLDINLIDGIPDTIHGTSRLIAKKIIKNRLSNEDSVKLNALVKKFKEDMNKFYNLISYASYTDEQLDMKTSKWSGWRYVHEARSTGWFPHMGDEPTISEYIFCKENGIPVKESSSKKKALSGKVSHNEEEINAAMAKTLEDLIGRLNGQEESKHEQKSQPTADVFVIDMKMIENIADMAGEYFNSKGGFDKVIDEATFNEDIRSDAAAFSIGTVIKTILTGGKKVVPTVIGLLGPVIDLASGAIKKSVIREPESMPKAIEGIIPQNTQIAIDEGVDKIKGLANLLRGIIAELCIIRDAEDVDTQIEAIDRIAKLLKDNLNMFSDAKFMKLMDRFMGKLFDIADQAGIKGEVATEVVQKDESSAAMMPANVMPAVADAEMKDDGTPFWMKAVSALSNAMRQEKSKEKPGFILQANHDAKIAKSLPATVQQELDALTPNFRVDPAVSKDYPWINQICGIAVRNGIAVSATPFYNTNPDGSYVMTSIRVESYIDGVLSKEKSFTIDLGYFIDRRIKMVFNCGVNGFGFLETCDEAYFVFQKNNEKQQIIDTNIFEAVFKFGISSIKEDDKRNMRMYNSNTTKVNRTIVWLTVPSWAVKGEDRKALKDSIFKMEKTIRAIAKANNMNFGRYAVYGFDPETMSYKLDNANVWFKGQPINCPHFVFNVTVAKGADGKYIKDEAGHYTCNCTIEYGDNVFGPEGPQFPNDATLICGSPEQNTELFTTGVDPTATEAEDDSTEVVFEVTEGEEGETPAIIADPEKEEEKPKKGRRSSKKTAK